MIVRVVRVVAVFPVLAVALFSGCASLARQAFQAPDIQLRDVRVREVGPQGGALDVVLDVFNPNDYRIDTARLTYTLFVDSTRVANGVIPQHLTLPRRMKTEVRLPISFTLLDLLKVGQVLSRPGPVSYRVDGLVTVATPFGELTRPYSGNGRYNVLRP